MKKYSVESDKLFNNFMRVEHQMTIDNYQVRAIFNKNLETGEFFLNDAWVVK